MTPQTQPGGQVDSKIKDMGEAYMIREKNINNP